MAGLGPRLCSDPASWWLEFLVAGIAPRGLLKVPDPHPHPTPAPEASVQVALFNFLPSDCHKYVPQLPLRSAWQAAKPQRCPPNALVGKGLSNETDTEETLSVTVGKIPSFLIEQSHCSLRGQVFQPLCQPLDLLTAPPFLKDPILVSLTL